MLTLTATELPRHMNCNGAIQLTPEFKPAYNGSDEVKQEGVALHWLSEQLIKENCYDAEKWIGAKTPNGLFVNDAMFEHACDYVDCLSTPELGTLHVETNTSYGVTDQYMINGRADAVNATPDTVTITDLKYGFKIVEPEMNWTLISHAVGFLADKQNLNVSKIRFRIFQPRQSHTQGPLRTWEIDAVQFESLKNTLFAALTTPNNDLNTSNHCNNCSKILACPAARMASINGIDVSTVAFNEHARGFPLGFEIDQTAAAITALKARHKALEELAIHQINKGDIVQGYRVESGEGRRCWNEGVTPEFIEAITKVNVSKPVEAITPLQAVKKGVPESVVFGLSTVPKTGPKLKKGSVDASKMFGERNKQNGN